MADLRNSAAPPTNPRPPPRIVNRKQYTPYADVKNRVKLALSDGELVERFMAFNKNLGDQPNCLRKTSGDRKALKCSCLAILNTAGDLTGDIPTDLYQKAVAHFQLYFGKLKKIEQQLEVTEWIRYGRTTTSLPFLMPFLTPPHTAIAQLNEIKCHMICKSALLSLLGVGYKWFNTCQDFVKDGVMPTHGLAGKVSNRKRKFVAEEEAGLQAFLKQFAEPALYLGSNTKRPKRVYTQEQKKNKELQRKRRQARIRKTELQKLRRAKTKEEGEKRGKEQLDRDEGQQSLTERDVHNWEVNKEEEEEEEGVENVEVNQTNVLGKRRENVTKTKAPSPLPLGASERDEDVGEERNKKGNAAEEPLSLTCRLTDEEEASVEDVTVVEDVEVVDVDDNDLIEKGNRPEAEFKAPSMMFPLTGNEQQIVKEAMYGMGPLNQVIAKSGADSVQRRSIQTLRPGVWLNDEVIHYFYEALTKRDKEMCQKDSSRKRCHFFKSFFITRLFDEGNSNPKLEGKYDYNNVKRWSKKVPGKDIFNLDKIIFPINQCRMHWQCAVAFMQEKRIQMYDSMGSKSMHYLQSLLQYVKDEHHAKKGYPLPDAQEWRLVPCDNAITPGQRNG
jgi:hypothetical protein